MAAKKSFIGGEERAAASLNEKTMPATMPSEEMSPMVSRIATLWCRVSASFSAFDRHVRRVRGISPARRKKKERKWQTRWYSILVAGGSARSRNRISEPRIPRKHLASPKPKPRDSPRDIGHVHHYGRDFPSRAGKKRGVGPQEDGGESAKDKKKKK